MWFRRLAWSTLLVGCAAAAPLAAQAAAPAPSLRPDSVPPRARVVSERWFYTGKTYGSEAAFGPVSEFMNEGFDALNDGYDRHVLHERVDLGFATVFRSMTHPVKVVRDYGVWRVIRNEFLPVSSESHGGGGWTANYGLHLFGSGMVSARMREWYEARGVPHPELAADLSMFAAHLMNEVTEASRENDYREETLPDLYVFDGLGMLLYHFRSIDHLMSNDRVQLTNWALQPVFVLPDSTLENVGQRFDLKVRLPGSTHWSAFTELGLAIQGGLSYRFDDGDALTIAGAPRVLGARVAPGSTRARTVWGTIASLYYDRDNSLLTNFTFDQAQSLVRLNVYPGVLRVAGFGPGFFMEQRAGRVHFGIASEWSPGIGIGAR